MRQQGLVASLSPAALHRQEAIFEFVYSERAYGADLVVLQDVSSPSASPGPFVASFNGTFSLTFFCELSLCPQVFLEPLFGLLHHGKRPFLKESMAQVFLASCYHLSPC